MALQSGTLAEKEKPLPELYEPVLVLFAPNAFVLRGTPEGPVGVVQEWQCKDP